LAVSCSFLIVRHWIVNNVAPAVPPIGDVRKQSRTHLFVAATLYSATTSVPVCIRNLSPSGALIESEAIPEPGTKSVLRRGSLQAAGRIAWKFDGKAGIAFDTEIYVSDWMSRLQVPQQQRIDRIVSDYKANGRLDPCPAIDDLHPGATSIEAELAVLRNDLAELGSSLIGDAILVATHPEIQALDIALQRIDRVIESLRSAGEA
jgi:hypothetical protein